MLVSGLSSSPVLPRVRALLDYVRTTAAGDCRTPRFSQARSAILPLRPGGDRRDGREVHGRRRNTAPFNGYPVSPGNITLVKPRPGTLALVVPNTAIDPHPTARPALSFITNATLFHAVGLPPRLVDEGATLRRVGSNTSRP